MATDQEGSMAISRTSSRRIGVWDSQGEKKTLRDVLEEDDQDDNWELFFQRLNVSRHFQEFKEEKALDVSEDEDDESWGTVVEACRLCWDRARGNVELLERRLVDLNLASLKQITLLREQLGRATHSIGFESMADDLVQFYEPLQFLKENMKELTIGIIADKLHQLETGTAPQTLVKTISTRNVDSHKADELLERIKAQEQRADKAERELAAVEEAFEELRDKLTEKVAQLELELAGCREREKNLKVRVEELNTELVAAQTLIGNLEDEVERMKQAISALEDEVERLETEMANSQQLVKQLEEALVETKTELSRVTSELEAAQEELARMQELVSKFEGRLRDAEERARIAEETLVEAQAQAEAATARAAELAGDLERAESRAVGAEARSERLQVALNEALATHSVDLATIDTQTDIGGERLAEIMTETEKVKSFLAHLQSKVLELLEDLTDLGHDKDVKDVTERLGLPPLLKQRTASERMHRDGKRREGRLMKVKEKIAEERKAALEVFINPHEQSSKEKVLVQEADAELLSAEQAADSAKERADALAAEAAKEGASEEARQKAEAAAKAAAGADAQKKAAKAAAKKAKEAAERESPPCPLELARAKAAQKKAQPRSKARASDRPEAFGNPPFPEAEGGNQHRGVRASVRHGPHRPHPPPHPRRGKAEEHGPVATSRSGDSPSDSLVDSTRKDSGGYSPLPMLVKSSAGRTSADLV